MQKMNRIYKYVEISRCNYEYAIKRAFYTRFDEHTASGKIDLAWSYYNAFIKAKLALETKKLEPKIERKEIEIMGNNWDRLSEVLQELFGEEASQIKKFFSEMAEKEVEKSILSEGFHLIKKAKVVHKVKEEMENE